MTIEEVLAFEEMQIFDRKSVKIEPKALAIPLIAFANADGGTIAIGISDSERRIEGTDYEIKKVNELLTVPYEFCEPSIPVRIEKVPCKDSLGRDNHVILMHIEPSLAVHANQADEAFVRVGDKSKKLSFEERTQLMYDKGERYFEDKAVPEATIEDIDMSLVASYIDKIGYSKSPIEYLKENKGFIKEKNGQAQINGAAILLFGKNPQMFFPRARIRFIRYEGTEEKFGAQMNVIKDVIFEGTILKMFDDRIVVESPGKLPGLVRTDNIRHTHFSRNPRIAEFLKAYNFVKEYGEGVNRMCNELEKAGLRIPEYRCNAFMLQTIIRNTKLVDENKKSAIEIGKSVFEDEKSAIDTQKLAIDVLKSAIKEKKYKEPTQRNLVQVYELIDGNQIFGTREIVKILNCSSSTAREIMSKLREMKVVCEIKGKGKGKYRFAYEDEIE